MIKVIPAILDSSYREIEHHIESVAAVADTIQIDFCDGQYVPHKTWWHTGKDADALKRLETEEVGLPYWDTINYEFDLMVQEPLAGMATYLSLGPSRVIFHLGSVSVDALVAYFETIPEIIRTTVAFGIAIGLDDDAASIAPLVPYIDTVQCMGIARVGYQGETLDTRVYEQIARVRTLYPDKTVSVDGGVTEENIPQLIKSGAHVLMMGSHLFRDPHPGAILEHIQALCQSLLTQKES